MYYLKNGFLIFEMLDKRSNVFLIEGNHQFVLVDTGKSNGWRKLKNGLHKVVEESKDLSWLVLTHTHFDHSANAAAIQEEYDLKVAVGRAEAQCLLDGESELPDGTNMLTAILSTFGKSLPQKIFRFDPVKPSLLIDDNYELMPGIRLISTPGHSEGSISLIVGDEIAIVGDVLFGMFEGYIMPPYANDVLALLESWKKLLDTNCRLFLPGHGKAITREALEEAYLRYQEIGAHV